MNELHYAGDTTKTPTYAVDVLWDGAEDHLFFNPAPYDWFYTPHAVPQIKVLVDGKLGACEHSATTNCNYARAAGTPKYTGVTSADPFTTATIVGTDLSVTAADYREITFAGDTCTPTYDSATQITCVITKPVAGSWQATVSLVATGNIETTGTPAAVVIAPTLTGVAPATVIANGG